MTPAFLMAHAATAVPEALNPLGDVVRQAPWALPLVVGGVFFATGVGGIVTGRKRKRTWYRDRAMVVGEATSERDNSHSAISKTYYHWVMERRGRDGRVHRAISSIGVTRLGPGPTFPFPVDVIVSPNDESKFDTLDDLRGGGVLNVVFALLGAIILAATVTLFLILR